ncbi:MAG: glycosyltransferase family 2 protein, partial [Planctomycetota bacterium]|nr:glycosyltransferase family 2 protein [Planctomycetota bacterium]
MFEGKSIAVVVPCYNEAEQVAGVLETMPDYVDCVIAVDDASTDGTADVVRRHIASEGAEPRTVLVVLPSNQGVGAAILAGYKEAAKRKIDVTAVMAGDGQMDPKQLRLLIAPVAAGRTDYAKANRLYYRQAWASTPRTRYLGNAFLSMLTKIASGYWHVADSQTGFTAVSLEALETIDLDGLYPRYGYPNDMLVRLNVYNFRVTDVPIRPVYNVGEQSKMRLTKVVPTMSWMIIKRFFWRLWRKYVIYDFHPLVLFYAASMFLGVVGVGLFARMIYWRITHGMFPPMSTMAWIFCCISSMQLGLFAMWFDMEMNKD